MPRDGQGQYIRNTGVFTGATAWQQTRDASRRIRADDADTHDQDIADALTASVARDGQAPLTGNLPAGNNLITGLSDPVDAQDAVNLRTAANPATIKYTAPGTGAIENDLQDILNRGFVSVAYYRDPADPDDTLSFQRAHDALAATGGAIWIPAGTYNIGNSDLDIKITASDIWWIGAGKSTKIQTTSAAANIFTLGTGSDAGQVRNIKFQNFAVDATVAKTAGYAFHVQFGARITWDHVYMAAQEDAQVARNLYDGIYLDRFDTCRIFACNITVGNKGLIARGNADQSWGAGVFIDSATRINGCGGDGVHLGGATASHFGTCTIGENTGNGIVLDDTLQPGVFNRECFVDPLGHVDGNGQNGVWAKSNGIIDLSIWGWVASNGSVNPDGAGVVLANGQAATMHANLTGIRLTQNSGSGLVANSGAVTMAGGVVKSNGQGANGGHGVSLENAAMGETLITGVVFKANGNASKGYDISIVNGIAAYTIKANHFKGNSGQGAINNVPVDTATRIIEGNNGYLAKGEIRTAYGDLTGNVSGAQMFSWQNPYDQKIIIKRVILQISAAGGTAGSEGDVGTAINASARSDNLIDGANLNAVTLYDNIDDRGGNGRSKQILDENGGTTPWITGRIATANAQSLAGTYQIEYLGF